MNILITTPGDEEDTHYLRAWTLDVVKEVKNKGHTLIHLDLDDVKRQNFESRIHKQNPCFIFLNGHGSADSVSGSPRTEIILKAGENDNLTNGRIVYARACDSLGGLGKKCVFEQRAKAYIGYSAGFIFPNEYSVKSSRAATDELARPAMEVSNAIPLALINGASVKDAMGKSQERYQKWVEHYQIHNTEEGDFIMAMLGMNMMNQSMVGNENATIYSD